MLPQTSQAGILQGLDHVQGESWALVEGRDFIAVNVLSAKKNRFLEEMGEMGVDVISGLEFSKEFKITEANCQLQVHIPQQRQHKFIYILILPTQEGAIFLVDKCEVFHLFCAYFRNPKKCSCLY